MSSLSLPSPATPYVLLRRLLALLLFGVLPLNLVLSSFGLDRLRLTDFRTLRYGGESALAGASPYPTPLAHGPRTTECLLSSPDCFNYPAPAAWLMAPFAALPYPVAAVLFFALATAAALGALRLLGVSDWRCYGMALGSMPVVAAIGGGTFSTFLLLAVAALWRFRDRALVAAGVLGLAISLKLFLWPLVLWLLLTRRFKAAAGSATVAFAALLGSWAALGFAGLRDYPNLVSELAEVWQWRGYTPLALGLALGLGTLAAKALAALVGGGVLMAALGFARRCDQKTFILAVAALLLLSPIVWIHYFVLLLVPLALASPRLSWRWAWLLPFYLLPGMADGSLVLILIGLGLIGVCTIAGLRAAHAPVTVA